MEFSIVSLILGLVGLIQGSCGTYVSNIGRHNKRAGAMDCFDAYENCWKIPGCQAALRILNKKCKFEHARCHHDSDWKLCRGVRDQLFMYGFPKERCKCDKKIVRCFKLSNKMFANPCFDEPRHVQLPARNNRTLPNREIATTSTTTERTTEHKKTTENEIVDLETLIMEESAHTETETESSTSTSTTQFLKPSPKTGHHGHLPLKASAIPTPTEEVIFGDEGFAKPPPGRRNSPYRWSYRKSQNSNIGQRFRPSEVVEATIVMKEWTTEEALNEESTVPSNKRSHYLPEPEVEWEMTTDMKYRLISIVVGSVFVLIILATMLYFAWIRISKLPFRYKQGKVVAKNNERVA